MINWDSLAAFWHMGGYGRFVWGAYGVTLAAMAFEAFGVRRRLSRAIAQVRAEASIEGDTL
jgi:heme exporter protein D